MDEEWEYIPEFYRHSVSNRGRIMSHKTGRIMKLSINQHGDVFINLTYSQRNYCLSVRKLVATAFVPRHDELFDTVILRDGVKDHLDYRNLLWRPRWFAWHYAHQFSYPRSALMMDNPIRNVKNGKEYYSVVHAGMMNGELWRDILKSTQGYDWIFPYGNQYEFI